MNVLMLIDVLRERRRLEAHNRWTREELLAHQARGLAVLRAYAVARSPFYRALHRGLEGAPLEALPTVTKANLMEHFNEVVTDRAIRLADVEQYLRHPSATDLFRGPNFPETLSELLLTRMAFPAHRLGRADVYLHGDVPLGRDLVGSRLRGH